MSDDIAYMTALEIRDAIAAKDLSPVEAAEAALAHAAGLALLPLANRRPLLFYVAVAAWRFAGPAALLLLR